MLQVARLNGLMAQALRLWSAGAGAGAGAGPESGAGAESESPEAIRAQIQLAEGLPHVLRQTALQIVVREIADLQEA